MCQIIFRETQKRSVLLELFCLKFLPCRGRVLQSPHHGCSWAYCSGEAPSLRKQGVLQLSGTDMLNGQLS